VIGRLWCGGWGIAIRIVNSIFVDLFSSLGPGAVIVLGVMVGLLEGSRPIRIGYESAHDPSIASSLRSTSGIW
jgi:hypothetical protein